ncbi:hypothetical protein ACIQVU_19375 [Lysinibacillus sp. NPDC098008]|uniref:hypothetical protein n=1 Tax=Lysinibacillus sp. NPDC098008 TaxID=3364146 RepID=UPI0038003240
MQGLNGIDSNLLLKALEERNATALIPVQSSHIQSVHQIDKNKLQVTLKTGDSMTLHLEHGPTAYVTEQKTNSFAAVSNEEGQKAIQLLKAKKYFNEKGVNVAGLNDSELVDVADLARLVNNEPLISSVTTTAEEERIVNEFKQLFSK